MTTIETTVCRYCTTIKVPDACVAEHTWRQVESLANAIYDAMPLAEETESYGRDHQIGFGFLEDAVAIVNAIFDAAEVPWDERADWLEDALDTPEWLVEMRPETPNGVRFAVNGIEFYVPHGEGFTTAEPWTVATALEANDWR